MRRPLGAGGRLLWARSPLSWAALAPGLGQGWIQEGSRSGTRAVLPPACGGDAPSLGRFSVDEGLTWSTHNFTSTSVFVDGLLSEPGDETLVMT